MAEMSSGGDQARQPMEAAGAFALICSEAASFPERGRLYQAAKRVFDLVFAVVGLLVFSPIAIGIALAVKLSDGGPVFYRQRRVGLHGRCFDILKFRSMVVGAAKMGPAVTRDADPRITRIGRILRRTKLDEFPQLWNVLKGEMSFVGPRPEVPRYVACYTPEQRQILRFKPGITDLATLVFRDEETLLRNAVDVEDFYVAHCIPRKFHLNLQYARRASLLEDVLIILETLCPYWLGIASGYALLLGASLMLAYGLRFDFQLPPGTRDEMERLLFVVVPLQMFFLFSRRQFSGLLSYFDVTEMRQLATGLALAAGVQLIAWFATDGAWNPPRSVILIDFILAFLLLSGARTWFRFLRQHRTTAMQKSTAPAPPMRLGVIGAGTLGAWLAFEINVKGKGGRHIEVFFDDDPDKWQMHLHGIPVAGMPECLLDGSWSSRLDEVIIAMPGARNERIEQVLLILKSANIPARKLPLLDDLLAQPCRQGD